MQNYQTPALKCRAIFKMSLRDTVFSDCTKTEMHPLAEFSAGQDRIIVKIILNLVNALSACGCWAGMRIISPPVR
jgi:hypothetical protein